MSESSDDELDPREVFPLEMAKWIHKKYPDFDAIHEAGDDEAQFKNKVFQEFRERFGATRCDEIPECRRKFRRKFANRALKLRKAAQKQVPIGLSGGKPFYLLPDAPETKARDLYKTTHRDEITKEANRRREALGQDHHHIPALFQQVTKELWDGLPQAERDSWTEAAAAKNADTVLDGSIFENQQQLPRTLFSLLQGTLHEGRGGIGVGAYHVLYAFRNSNEEMIIGSLTVNSAASESVPFQTACVDYKKTVEAPWEQYSHQNVGFNQGNDHSQQFGKNDGGFYILPRFDEETGTLQEYRNTLRLFIEACFFQVVPRTGVMPAMPWVDFLNHPVDFLNAKLIIDGILTRPDAMPSGDLRAFAQRIHEFQAANTTVPIFTDADFILAAMLRRKAHEDAQKSQIIEEFIDPIDIDNSHPPNSPVPSPLPSSDATPGSETPATLPVSRKKRKATEPPSADIVPPVAPLRRSTRYNTASAPVPHDPDAEERPSKRRRQSKH